MFFCDDNFIGSKKQARALLQELTPWLKSRGEPFSFLTQASVNLGQDLEMIDLLTEANLGEVFIGIESPDDNVLETSRKYHNIKNPLVESLNNLKKNGMAVMGSFIIGLDGETKGAGERICAFIDQTDIPWPCSGSCRPRRTPACGTGWSARAGCAGRGIRGGCGRRWGDLLGVEL